MVTAKKKKKSLSQDTTYDKIYLGIVYFIVAFVVLITLYPLIYIVSASLSTPHYVNSGEMWLWPVGFTTEGYRILMGNTAIWRGYANTIYYTLLGTSINLLVTIPAAYALSRKDFFGRNLFMTFLIIPMFIGGGLIPTFLLIRSLGMFNTVWALVLPGATGVFNIVVTRTFFQQTIPREMEEAATMDGCNDFVMFIKIVLPLSLPIIAVMALFFGVGHWNSWFGAMIYLQDRARHPLQLVLREILVQENMQSMPDVGVGMDASQAELMRIRQQMAQVIRYGVMIVSTLPIIMVYPFLQKYFVKGVMVGSLKG